MINWQFVSRARFNREKRRADAAELALGEAVIRQNGNGTEAMCAKREAEWLRAELTTANDRLSRIAALETPSCAHGVKKAARIARGEL